MCHLPVKREKRKENESMKTDYTPGPWAVELPYGEPGVYVTAANPRYTNPLICRLIDQAQSKEGKANARLIAAAPDLLDALTDLVGGCGKEGDLFSSKAMDKARIAIMKAHDSVI